MKIDFSEKLEKKSANGAFADMFGLNAGSKKEGAVEIDIDLLTPFKNHPFRLYEGEKLRRMVESIKENGVMTPIIVRKKEDGTNEILAGHNRVNASKLAGLTKVPTEIKVNLTEAQAKIIVTDSNFLQRSVDEMFPSELAKSLKMQLEACKEAKQKQEYINAIESGPNAYRSKDWNEGVQLEHPIKSRDIIAKSNKMSTPSIQRYIRLNHLNEGLLNMVDEGNIKLVPAVSLSYLSSNEQNILFSILSTNDYKIDMKKADKLKERSGKLAKDDILAISSGEFFEKKNRTKVAAFIVKPKLISRFFTSYSTQTEITSTIEIALEEYFERRRQAAEDVNIKNIDEEVNRDEEN